MLFHRLDQLVDGKAQRQRCSAAPTTSRQLGFRKIIDTTFMIATMVTGDPTRRPAQVLRALRAPSATSTAPDLYTHYYRREFPARSTPRWIPAAGVRASVSCYEPYTKEVYERRSGGSPTTASSPTAAWARATTRKPSSARRNSHHRRHAPLALAQAGRGGAWLRQRGEAAPDVNSFPLRIRSGRSLRRARFSRRPGLDSASAFRARLSHRQPQVSTAGRGPPENSPA